MTLHLTCATVLWDSGQTHRKITAEINDLCPDHSTHLRTAWLSGIKKCIPQSGHRTKTVSALGQGTLALDKGSEP